MKRPAAIASAAAISLTLVAGSAAIAANVGILDASPKEPVGQFQPAAQVEPPASTSSTTAAPEVQTVYVDEYVSTGSAPAATGATAPSSVATAAPPAAAPTSPPPATYDDHGAFEPSGDSDDSYEHESHSDSDDHPEYEGAEADD